MAMQALILGFGGSGAHILTYLKELAVFKHGQVPGSMRFLLFDTIADWEPGRTIAIAGGRAQEKIAESRLKDEGRAASLDPKTEYFHLRDGTPSLAKYVNDILPRSDAAWKFSHLHKWLNAAWLNAYIPNDKLNITDGAAQQRQIGRFAFFQNIKFITDGLRRTLGEMAAVARGATLNVWIVGSSAGGTGAGCMLDAAFLARMVAEQQRLSIRVIGVIVLPDVYEGLEGISKARAYSLFRELWRMQRRGFELSEDRYALEDNTLVDIEQPYDDTGRYKAYLQNKLFDNVFVVGQRCQSEEDRVALFSSIVSAMDPYTDDQSGPPQLEKAVNRDFDTVSFGASRLYLPLRTFEELFAWEQTREWLEKVTANQSRRTTEIAYGSDADRKRQADDKVASLLPWFQTLLGYAERSSEEKEAYARRLDPNTLISEGLGFAAGGVSGLAGSAGELELVKLAYVNPFISLTQVNEMEVPPEDRVVRTYRENRKTGFRESQEDSRDRFIRELDAVAQRYRDSSAPQGSFGQAYQVILKVASDGLQKRLDEQISGAFAKESVAMVESRPDQGTLLTRLREELRWITMLESAGTLERISGLVNTFITSLDSRRHPLDSAVQAAVRTLRDARGGVFGGFQSWVEEYQLQARDTYQEFMRWYQRRELLLLVQKLIEKVRERYMIWRDLVDRSLEALVLARPSALSNVYDNIDRLEKRLSLLAKDRTALIGLAQRPDDNAVLQGYADQLRQEAVLREQRSLAKRSLESARWQLDFESNRQPQLSIAVTVVDEPITINARDFRNLHQIIRERFQRHIIERLSGKTIFDYLDFLDKEKGIGQKAVIERLNEVTKVLIYSNQPSDTRLVYKQPPDRDKLRIAELLNAALQNVREIRAADAEQLYTDPYSIILLKVVTPNPNEIQDLIDCANEYADLQQEPLTTAEDHNQTIRRGLVYHVFRGEQEAWFIERRLTLVNRQRLDPDRDHLPPRLVRLLDEPERIKAFVEGIGTGVIYFDDAQEERWLFKDEVMQQLIPLTEKNNKSLMMAAVTFVLRKRDYKILTEIKLDNVNESATQAAKLCGKKKSELVAEFVNGSKLDELLNAYVRPPEQGGGYAQSQHERLKLGLKRVFQFYGHPDTRLGLENRLQL